MILYSSEVPVAYSMVALAQGHQASTGHVFQSFLCYWAAFNNIYTTIHDRDGSPKQDYEWDENYDPHIPQTRTIDGVKVPKVTPYPFEWQQIQTARLKFRRDLQHELIMHDSAEFFACRTPLWDWSPIEHDNSGRRLNGVINVGHTLDRRYPVWSPLDRSAFESYRNDRDRRDFVRTRLVKQVTEIIYTVRNNISHGGKIADDRNDLDVVGKATPLLRMIVLSFLEPHADASPVNV